jgi:hypothetical protein
VVLRAEDRAYHEDGDGRYVLFTALADPVAEQDDLVTIVRSADAAAVG